MIGWMEGVVLGESIIITRNNNVTGIKKKKEEKKKKKKEGFASGTNSLSEKKCVVAAVGARVCLLKERTWTAPTSDGKSK